MRGYRYGLSGWGSTVDRMITQATERLREAAREIKPHLRGWLHLGTFPLSVAAGIVLVSLSPDAQTRIATAVFALSASLLFGSLGAVPPRALGSALARSCSAGSTTRTSSC